MSTHDFVKAIRANRQAMRLLSLMGTDEASKASIAAGDEAAIHAMFKDMDLNGDGELTWSEWSRYVGKRRISLAKAKLCRALIQTCRRCAEGLGWGGCLSLARWSAAMRH